MNRFAPLRLLLATAMTATLALVMQPVTPAAADVDVYTTPGRHSVNGREWSTICSDYSSSVKRCRTEILATQVTYEDGRYVQKTDWVFNNLTYLPAPKKTWAGNPLAENGAWTSEDGRQWRTECDTPATGRNGCRSYIYATTIGVVSESPRTYGRINQWMFNNILQFSAAPTPPPPAPEPDLCRNLPIPAGYKVSTVDGRKIPHLIKTPYTPNTRYNPTSIAQFTRTILRNTTLKSQDPVKWDCLFDLATTALMEGSETETYKGQTVRWFPYMFEFDATGTDEIPALEPGWKSGLAQGALLGLMAELASSTGDDTWLNVGDEILNSFEVPLDEGGFLHRDEGFLWFEEYPTETPTTVLNGHLEAIIGLDLWARNTGEGRGARARELFNEAIPVLEGALPLQEVDVEGGILTSYDLVRGYPAAPLRMAGKNVRVNSAQLNGDDVNFPVANPTTTDPPRLLEPFFNVRAGGRVPNEWRSIAAPSFSVTERGGTVTVRSDRNEWQGIHQTIPSNRFEASKPLTMTLDAKLTLSAGKGLSGRVAVYQQCGPDKKDVSLLYETQKTRGRDWATYTMGFNAPPANCDMLVQLLHSSYGLTGTTVQYRDISLTQAEAVGRALKPGDHQADDLSVRKTPTVALTLTGSGTGQLQAYSEGQWQDVGEAVTLTRSPTEIEVSERYAGRNLHYGYHETHVLELLSLYERAYKAGFSASNARFLWDYAARWEPMAPARHGSIPPPIEDRAQARTLQREPAPDGYELPLEDGAQSWTSDLDSYELPLVDPFELLLEE